MACQPYFIVLTVRTRDVRNHDRLQPVCMGLAQARVDHFKNSIKITSLPLLMETFTEHNNT